MHSVTSVLSAKSVQGKVDTACSHAQSEKKVPGDITDLFAYWLGHHGDLDMKTCSMKKKDWPEMLSYSQEKRIK